MTGARSPAIECRGLAKAYGDVHALRGLDLAVPTGSIFGLLGPNGAGKTTLLRLLTGLRRPTAGTASIQGEPIGPDTARRIGYLDQDPRFYPWLSGLELLRLSGSLYGLAGSALSAAIDRAIEVAGLAEFVGRRVAGYSGGMRQRLGIAQAVVHDPHVLLLDEPVSSLDPAGRHDVLEVLAKLRRTSTVVVSTHILADVERVCDRVAILDHGELIVESEKDALLERYATPVYEIELSGADEIADRLAVLIRARPWATSLMRTGSHLRIGTSGADGASTELLALLADTRSPVERFERLRVCVSAGEALPAAVAERWAAHMRELGQHVGERNDEDRVGSTDMGNVMQILPGIHPYIAISDDPVPGHSTAFRDQAATPEAHERAFAAAKALALAAIEVLAERDVLERARREFEQRRDAAAGKGRTPA